MLNWIKNFFVVTNHFISENHKSLINFVQFCPFDIVYHVNVRSKQLQAGIPVEYFYLCQKLLDTQVMNSFKQSQDHLVYRPALSSIPPLNALYHKNHNN
jgi:hypothetical protein